MAQILVNGVSKQHLRLQCIFDEEFMPYLGVTPQDIFRQRARKPGSMFFMKSSDDVLDALANIGISDEPSPNVVKGCEELICKWFSAGFSDADKL